MKISAREILKESEIKNKLKECFKKCAAGRQQLRECVVSSMNAGLSKEEILVIISKMDTGFGQDEASLCSIAAIGQAMRYEEKHANSRIVASSDNEKKSVKIKLQKCLRKCGLARKQLRKCIVNALDAGLSKEEILAFADEIVGGVGRDDVSLCGIIAVEQVLSYEESARAKPIDVIKERELERGDA
jgi:galactitol-specific phosphotransferase system IIB component